ncbi:hypothetical protein RLT58_21175 [Streptomyces sp. ITFR-16]|nr:hypothetical protein [Streptomyces sp. ITFR-16]WNI24264.1 hypothetical protein RLT58_21175 [Streptomyces sp. ITFR-16]
MSATSADEVHCVQRGICRDLQPGIRVQLGAEVPPSLLGYVNMPQVDS